MLKQRIITAIVLLAIVLPALFYPSFVPLAVLGLVMMGAGGWEWGRLNGLGGAASLLLGALCPLLCLLAWQAGWLEQRLPWLWSAAALVWVLGGALLLRLGVAGWPRVPRTLRLIVGIALLCLAWLALVQARIAGINFLLSVLCLVWMADIGAYFAGRSFGQRLVARKLAPAISPGKSWEGVWGGMLGVLVLAFGWSALDAATQAHSPSLYTLLAQRGTWLLVLGALFLAALSVVGDLAESLVKRSAGMKDSSGLLPGHGGVLDRIDALLPTLPLAMMLAQQAAST